MKVVFTGDKLMPDRIPNLLIFKISGPNPRWTAKTVSRKNCSTSKCGEMCGELEMTRDLIVAFSIRVSDRLIKDSVKARSRLLMTNP